MSTAWLYFLDVISMLFLPLLPSGCVSVTQNWRAQSLRQDVAVELLHRNAETDCADAGRRTVASVDPPRTTAQELEQTYYSFNWQIK